MPGTPLPATASAVSASTPKMLLIQAEANPWSAARCNSSRSAVIGLGPVGSCSDTPILMLCLPCLAACAVAACLAHSAGPAPGSPGYRATAGARSPRPRSGLPVRTCRTRMRHRHLGGQCRVVGDQQPVDRHAAAPAQFMDEGQYGRRDSLSGHTLAVYLANRLGGDLLEVHGRVRRTGEEQPRG